MRVALIADTHGVLDARIEAAITDAELIVHAGDVGAGVADRLRCLGTELVIVRGNNDPADAPWPASRIIDLPGGQLVVTHGDQWPAKTRHERLRREWPDAAAVVCGHSHRRVVDQTAAPWVLNPGAAGRSRAYGGPGWLALDIEHGHWRVTVQQYPPLRRR